MGWEKKHNIIVYYYGVVPTLTSRGPTSNTQFVSEEIIGVLPAKTNPLWLLCFSLQPRQSFNTTRWTNSAQKHADIMGCHSHPRFLAEP